MCDNAVAIFVLICIFFCGIIFAIVVNEKYGRAEECKACLKKTKARLDICERENAELRSKVNFYENMLEEINGTNAIGFSNATEN